MAVENTTNDEQQEESGRGRTRWGRFALVMGVGALGIGVMFTGLSQGAMAASFSISGVAYKASADKLSAEGVVQYGSVDRSANKAHPVLVNGFQDATLDNFCQSFVVPDIPGVGDMTVRIEAPGKGGFQAKNLVIGVESVTGDLTLNNVEIGRDAGQFTKGPQGLQGQSGAFGIQADSATIDDLRQVAWSTTASTLRLNDVKITTSTGREAACF